jgi:hypothetical protein
LLLSQNYAIISIESEERAMLKYCKYGIIESEEDFKKNFIVGNYVWESDYFDVPYYERPTNFPCAYKHPGYYGCWKPCSIKEAKEFWNQSIPEEIENLQKFLKKVKEKY